MVIIWCLELLSTIINFSAPIRDEKSVTSENFWRYMIFMNSLKKQTIKKKKKKES